MKMYFTRLTALLTLLLCSFISYAQIPRAVLYGATRTIDTSQTAGYNSARNYKATDLTDSNKVLAVDHQGNFKLKDAAGIVDSSVYVTVSRLADSLTFYERLLGFPYLKRYILTDYDARPYDSNFCNRAAIQAMYNDAMGVVETYDSLNQSVTYVRVRDSFLGGVVVIPGGIWYVKNSLIKSVNGKPFNGQIYIPALTYRDSTKFRMMVTLETRGAVPVGVFESSISNAYSQTWINGGSRIQSTIGYDGSEWPSVWASEPGDSVAIGSITVTPSVVLAVNKNLWIRTKYDAANGGLQCGNFDYRNFHDVMHINCRADGNVSGSTIAATTTNNVFNLHMNNPFQGALSRIENGLSAHGKIGLVTGEHTIADNHFVAFTNYAVEPLQSVHTVELRNMVLHWNKYQFHTGSFGAFSNTGGSTSAVAAISGSIRVESPSSGAFVRTSPDFMDSTNIMMGELSMIAYSNATGFGNVGTVPTFYRATRLCVKVPAEINGATRLNLGSTIYCNNTTRSGATWKGVSPLAQTNILLDNDRGAFAVSGSFLGLATTGSQSTLSLGGKNMADVQWVMSFGANSRGLMVGTNTLDSLPFVTNNTTRGGFLPAGTFFTVGDVQVGGSNLTFLTTGAKLKFNTGSNASFGTATLSSGTVTVNTTAVTALSRIILTKQSCSNCGDLHISSTVNGTSFTITSSNGSDASTVAWWIIDSNN